MKKRYWLRGGIILVILFAIVTLILIPFSQKYGGDCYTFCFPLWSMLAFIGATIITGPIRMILGDPFIGSYLMNSIVGLIVEAAIFYFIIGAIIGWIYGKIRGNKTQN